MLRTFFFFCVCFCLSPSSKPLAPSTQTTAHSPIGHHWHPTRIGSELCIPLTRYARDKAHPILRMENEVWQSNAAVLFTQNSQLPDS